MIHKIIQGRPSGGATLGLIKYVLDKRVKDETAELVGGNMMGRYASELNREMQSFLKIKPNIKEPTFHAVISLPDGETLNNDQWQEVTQAYLQKLGFDTDKNPYLVVKHTNTDHQHVHIVASRIDIDGNCVSLQNDRYKGMEVMREYEQKFWLKVDKKTPKKELKKTRPDTAEKGKAARENKSITGIEYVQNAIDSILSENVVDLNSKKDQDFFTESLNKKGIEVKLVVQSKGLTGASFRYNGIAYKGTQLGADYKAKKLVERGLDLASKSQNYLENVKRGQAKERVKAAIGEALEQKQTRGIYFENFLNERGISVDYEVPKPTPMSPNKYVNPRSGGRVTNIIYNVDGIEIKGSRLGKRYKYNAMNRRGFDLGFLDYKPDYRKTRPPRRVKYRARRLFRQACERQRQPEHRGDSLEYLIYKYGGEAARQIMIIVFKFRKFLNRLFKDSGVKERPVDEIQNAFARADERITKSLEKLAERAEQKAVKSSPEPAVDAAATNETQTAAKPKTLWEQVKEYKGRVQTTAPTQSTPAPAQARAQGVEKSTVNVKKEPEPATPAMLERQFEKLTGQYQFRFISNSIREILSDNEKERLESDFKENPQNLYAPRDLANYNESEVLVFGDDENKDSDISKILDQLESAGIKAAYISKASYDSAIDSAVFSVVNNKLAKKIDGVLENIKGDENEMLSVEKIKENVRADAAKDLKKQAWRLDSFKRIKNVIQTINAQFPEKKIIVSYTETLEMQNLFGKYGVFSKNESIFAIPKGSTFKIERADEQEQQQEQEQTQAKPTRRRGR